MKKKIKEFLCSIGMCWLIDHDYSFTDQVVGLPVYNSKCEVCGREYMVNSLRPILNFKVERDSSENY